jgi:hypothetical protein
MLDAALSGHIVGKMFGIGDGYLEGNFTSASTG